MAAPNLLNLSVKEAKAAFFDRAKVMRAVEKAKRRSLAKGGGLVRTVARRSMRKVKDPLRRSPPGKPPFAHEGSLRRLLFFAWDPGTRSVIVGPTGFKGSTAPSTLEFGGTVKGDGRVIRVRDGVGRGKGGRFTSKAKSVRLTGRVRIAPRPYMGPALEKSASKLPALWRDAVKGPGGRG